MEIFQTQCLSITTQQKGNNQEIWASLFGMFFFTFIVSNCKTFCEINVSEHTGKTGVLWI